MVENKRKEKVKERRREEMDVTEEKEDEVKECRKRKVVRGVEKNEGQKNKEREDREE